MPEKFNELLLKQDIIELYNAGITPDYGYLMNGRFEKDMIKTLYPLKSLSGNPISWEARDTEYLFPVVSLEPKQAGSGDPSPDNIRPITGYDSVTVNVRGKNVVDVDDIPIATIGNGGYYFSELIPFKPYLGATFTLSANVTCLTESFTEGWRLDLGAGNINYAKDINSYGSFTKEQGARISVTGTVNQNTANYKWLAFRLRVQTPTLGAKFEITNIMLEVNDTPTPYEPYQPGTTTQLSLPETIYGGTVDVVTGAGEKVRECIEFDGTEIWYTWGPNSGADGVTGFYHYRPIDGDPLEPLIISSILLYNGNAFGGAEVGCALGDLGNVNPYFIFSVSNSILSDVSSNQAAIDSWKSYLAAQAAAGTPVQVAYKLATPEPFQATGNQALTIQPGKHTMYTDGDTISLSRKARRLEV